MHLLGSLFPNFQELAIHLETESETYKTILRSQETLLGDRASIVEALCLVLQTLVPTAALREKNNACDHGPAARFLNLLGPLRFGN
jgi:hypothetical protein